MRNRERRTEYGGPGRRCHSPFLILGSAFFITVLAGCAEPTPRASADPLIGNHTPLPASGSILPDPQPVQTTGGGPPPVPVTGATLSNTALASGNTGKPLDGSHELHIGDPTPANGPGATLRPPQVSPASRQQPAPAPVAGAAPGQRVTSFEQGMALLEAHGVKWQRLEKDPDTGAWKLTCTVVSPKNPNVVHTFEGQAATVPAVLQAVLEQIEREMPA